MDTDRNILFGVLALRANLIDGGRFAEACRRWTERRDRPMADLLVERGWLTEADRTHVEYLLDRNVQQHGDARAALKSAADASVWRAVAADADPDLRAWLAEVVPGAHWLREQDTEERKRSWGLAAAIAGGVLLLLMAGGGVLTLGGLFVFRDRARMEAMMAREQMAVAEAHSREARAAMDEMLAQAADEVARVADEEAGPGKPVQRELLEQAVKIYEGVVKEQPDDPAARKKLAAAHLKLGELHARLKQTDQAEQASRKALDLLQRMAAEPGAKPEVRRDLALTQLRLADLHLDTNRPQEAEQSVRQSLALLKSLAQDHPDRAEFRLDLAEADGTLGRLMQQTGRLAEAEAAYREALVLLQEYQRSGNPGDKRSLQLLAKGYRQLGRLHKQLGRAQEAEHLLGQAEALEQKLKADKPAKPSK
jgi:tetratricopeptide (TPR) repeat protein